MLSALEIAQLTELRTGYLTNAALCESQGYYPAAEAARREADAIGAKLACIDCEDAIGTEPVSRFLGIDLPGYVCAPCADALLVY